MRIVVTSVLLFLCAGAAQAEDCSLAERYADLGAKAKAENRDEDALSFAQRAAEACERYEYWQAWGEQAAEYTDDARRSLAATAFVKAKDLSSSDAQAADAIAGYAVLLFDSGDPQRALTYIREAKRLAPNNAAINRRHEQIRERAANLQAEDVVRGLGDLAFAPMVLSREASLENADADGGADRAPPPPPVETKRVEVPMYFITGTTRLDEATAQNLSVLAATIATGDFDDRRFLFVGHADVRGDAAMNMRLSQDRANTIASQVVALQPTLANRIDTDGKGESEPVNLDTTAAAHRENRRLEVVVID